MTWYADLSQCDYFGADAASFLRSVGWLESGRPYSQGQVETEVYHRLVELCKEPWQPVVCMGPHNCDLCRYESAAMSTKNLIIPGDGFLYVAPEGIVHYMNVHEYAPPEEFCLAVLACPSMQTMEYRKALLANGGRVLMKASPNT